VCDIQQVILASVRYNVDEILIPLKERHNLQRYLTHAQRVSHALRRVESQLRNWHDDPDCPHQDIDRMLAATAEIRQWVQAHVIADLERTEEQLKRATIGSNKRSDDATV
jgi:hypothetical protein